MRPSDQCMCVAFIAVGLIPIWGVLYAFWLSFKTFPIDSRVWDMDHNKVLTLPNASLSVVDTGNSIFVCLQSVDGGNDMALIGNMSSFYECTLLDTLVYLRGEGGLCLTFLNKAQANAFVASVGFEDLAQDDSTEDDLGEDGSSEDDAIEDNFSEDDPIEDDLI